MRARAAAAAPADAAAPTKFNVPTGRSFDAWDTDSDDDLFRLDGWKRKRRKTKRKPIKINPKMKGVFTRKAKKHKMSVQKYARYIIKKYKGKTKNKRQLKLLKQAVFAKTAKKWKKRKRKFSRKKRRK